MTSPTGTYTQTYEPEPTNTPFPVLAAATVDVVEDAAQFGLLNGFDSHGPAMMLTAAGYEMGDPIPKGLDMLVTFGQGELGQKVEVKVERPHPNFIWDFFRMQDTWIIKLPSLPEGSGVPVLFRNLSLNNWVMVPEQRYGDLEIRARVNYLGFYQVYVPILTRPFSFGEVYVYPNPVRGQETPTLHIEVGKADVVRVRIYDVAGDLIVEDRLDSPPILVNGRPAYEQKIDPGLFRSGAYIGVVTAEKSGKETVRKKFRFTIIK